MSHKILLCKKNNVLVKILANHRPLSFLFFCFFEKLFRRRIDVLNLNLHVRIGRSKESNIINDMLGEPNNISLIGMYVICQIKHYNLTLFLNYFFI